MYTFWSNGGLMLQPETVLDAKFLEAAFAILREKLPPELLSDRERTDREEQLQAERGEQPNAPYIRPYRGGVATGDEATWRQSELARIERLAARQGDRRHRATADASPLIHITPGGERSP